MRVPTSGCSASSEEFSCSKALDGNMRTDFATNGEGAGAWIEVREFSLCTLNRIDWCIKTDALRLPIRNMDVGLFLKITNCKKECIAMKLFHICTFTFLCGRLSLMELLV